MKQEEFYQELSNIPDMPDLYPEIKDAISRSDRKKFRHAILSIAATVLVAIGIMNITQNHMNEETQTIPVASQESLSDEVIDELQIISDFMDGNSIDDDLKMYALVNYDDK